MESNWISYVDTMLQYHLHINPKSLTDEEWAEKWVQLQDIREKEANANEI